MASQKILKKILLAITLALGVFAFHGFASGATQERIAPTTEWVARHTEETREAKSRNKISVAPAIHNQAWKSQPSWLVSISTRYLQQKQVVQSFTRYQLLLVSSFLQHSSLYCSYLQSFC